MVKHPATPLAAKRFARKKHRGYTPADSRKGGEKTRAKLLAEQGYDAFEIAFRWTKPGELPDAEVDVYIDRKRTPPRRTLRVSVRQAEASTVAAQQRDKDVFDYWLAWAFEAVATPECGTAALAKKIVPYASEVGAGKAVNKQLCTAKAEHVWTAAMKPRGRRA